MATRDRSRTETGADCEHVFPICMSQEYSKCPGVWMSRPKRGAIYIDKEMVGRASHGVTLTLDFPAHKVLAKNMKHSCIIDN